MSWRQRSFRPANPAANFHFERNRFLSSGRWRSKPLLGRGLARQERLADARTVLEKTLVLRHELGDPRVEETERLMQQIWS